jgi:hypothetical protein
MIVREYSNCFRRPNRITHSACSVFDGDPTCQVCFHVPGLPCFGWFLGCDPLTGEVRVRIFQGMTDGYSRRSLEFLVPYRFQFLCNHGRLSAGAIYGPHRRRRLETHSCV